MTFKETKRYLTKAKFHFTLIFLLLAVSFFTTNNLITQEPPKKIIKSTDPVTMQLFSWKSGANWEFSIFKGEHFGVMKEEKEIKDPRNTIGLDEVKKRLSLLPENSIILWRNVGPESPSEEIKIELREFCRQKKFRLLEIPYRRMQTKDNQNQEKKEPQK